MILINRAKTSDIVSSNSGWTELNISVDLLDSAIKGIPQGKCTMRILKISNKSQHVRINMQAN